MIWFNSTFPIQATSDNLPRCHFFAVVAACEVDGLKLRACMIADHPGVVKRLIRLLNAVVGLDSLV